MKITTGIVATLLVMTAAAGSAAALVPDDPVDALFPEGRPYVPTCQVSGVKEGNPEVVCPLHGHTPLERTVQCLVEQVKSGDVTLICPRAADSGSPVDGVVDCVMGGGEQLARALLGEPAEPYACNLNASGPNVEECVNMVYSLVVYGWYRPGPCQL